MLVKVIFGISLIIFKVTDINAIFCNFTFIESDLSDEVVRNADVIMPSNLTKAQKFNCDQDEYSFVNSSELDSIGNRFNPIDFEDSCIASKRFITPKFLNNVYNHLTPILNGVTFVQRIQIVECRNRREQCNDQSYPPANFQYICHQEYLTITLSALNNGGSIFEDEFYVPSACSCRLIRLARKVEIIYV